MPSLNSQFSTIVELLQYRSQHQPDRIAYRFLENGEREQACLTYGELGQQVRAIAGSLEPWRGERALLLYRAGLEFIAAFLGCLQAGVIPVPAYPPRRNQKLSRLLSIAADSQASIALTVPSVLETVEKMWATEPVIQQLRWLPTETVLNPEERSHPIEPTKIEPNTLAFLQYTSGATGNPKGVMVSHENIIYNQQMISDAFQHDETAIGLGWLPPFHDMGLIGNVLQPLYQGIPCILMPPEAFLQKPIRWLRAISHYRATTSGGPNFAYDLCVDRVSEDRKATLDLSCWKVAFNGSEPCRMETMKRFIEAFRECGFRPEAFYPCYGMAETTLIVSGGIPSRQPVFKHVQASALEQNQVVPLDRNQEDSRTLVSCGRAILEQDIIIVDPNSQTQCPNGQVGEIWVAGKHVATGYWHRDSETQATFAAYLSDTQKGPYLRTGDLGFLDPEGELFVTGRSKEVIIIRGRNYYPQDIELVAQKSHRALRPNSGAAFSVEIEGTERLIIVHEVERSYLRKLNVAEVASAVRRAVSEEFELQVHSVLLLKTNSILKTSSGKIQRRGCRSAFLNGTLKSLNVVGTWFTSEPVAVSSSFKESVTKKNISENPDWQRSRFLANERIQWLRRYADECINSQLIDERRCIPPYIILDFGNQGLLGMQVSPEYGGLGLTHADTLRIIEQLGAIDQTLSLLVGLNNVLGIRPLMNFGNQRLKKEYLPLLAQGRELAAFALTEPEAGSNPQAIRARATAISEDRWRLNGTKIWSGSGAWASLVTVFVKQHSEKGQPQGITSFILPRGTPGLRQGPEALTMGMRGMVQNKLYLEDALVSSELRLGKPGQGMQVAQDAMMYGRLGIAAMCVGGMKRCAQLMVRYGSRRTISTGRLLDNPWVTAQLSETMVAITALEILVRQVTQMLDRKGFVPVEIYTACKIAGAEFYWRAADTLVQLLGGRGYIETNMAPQILRDARILRIFEGPTEALCMFLGSKVLENSADLNNFFAVSLGVPETGQRLWQAADEIETYRYKKGKQASIPPGYIRQQVALLVGGVATFAILLGVLQSQAQRSNQPKISRALEWTRLEFDRRWAQALTSGPVDPVSLRAEEIVDGISQYRDDIGDVEQTLAGEDRQQDPLLSRQSGTSYRDDIGDVEQALAEEDRQQEPLLSDQSEASSVSNPKQQSGSKRARPIASPTLISQVSRIQSWTLNWLGQRLGIPPQQIDPSQPFAEYGLDSVIAVELAYDLEQWLGLSQPLDATIAWSFPTIESLSSYLAEVIDTESGSGQIYVRPTSDSSPIKPSQEAESTSARTDDPQQELSSEELEYLLVKRISESRKRREAR